MARHPKLMEAWGSFGGYILRGSTLPARDRELLILRTAWLCGTGYEWGYHSRSAKAAGVSDEEIARVQVGHLASGWSSFDRGLMRAADQLHNDAFITRRTWGTLKARYSDEQMMDVVFTVGQYTMVSMAINSFGVQRDLHKGSSNEKGLACASLHRLFQERQFLRPLGALDHVVARKGDAIPSHAEAGVEGAHVPFGAHQL